MDTPPLYQFEAFPETSLFEGAWCLSLPPGEQVQEIAPDGCCELIVHLGRPPLELRADGEAEQQGALIYGPLTRVLELRPQGALDMMGLRFRSWAIGAFCPDPFALRNRAQPLDMVIGREVAGLRRPVFRLLAKRRATVWPPPPRHLGSRPCWSSSPKSLSRIPVLKSRTWFIGPARPSGRWGAIIVAVPG